jgi:hypothetical protein
MLLWSFPGSFEKIDLSHERIGRARGANLEWHWRSTNSKLKLAIFLICFWVPSTSVQLCTNFPLDATVT